MKLYDEKEIARILKRAGELSRDSSGEVGVGLTLEELKELGNEAGIDPAMIIRAAKEAELEGDRDEKSNIFGGPMTCSRDVLLDLEVDAAEWEEMLVHIREGFSDPGIVSTRPDIFEWTSQDKQSKAHVTVRNSEGRSYLSVFWSSESLAVVPFIPVFGGVPFTILLVFQAMGLSGAIGIATWLLVTMAIFMMSRSIAQTIRKRQGRKIDRLISRLERSSERTERRSAIAHTATKEIGGVVRVVETPKAGLLSPEEDSADPPESDSARVRGRERL